LADDNNPEKSGSVTHTHENTQEGTVESGYPGVAGNWAGTGAAAYEFVKGKTQAAANCGAYNNFKCGSPNHNVPLYI
jgi:hypothetical protein